MADTEWVYFFLVKQDGELKVVCKRFTDHYFFTRQYNVLKEASYLLDGNLYELLVEDEEFSIFLDLIATYFPVWKSKWRFDFTQIIARDDYHMEAFKQASITATTRCIDVERIHAMINKLDQACWRALRNHHILQFAVLLQKRSLTLEPNRHCSMKLTGPKPCPVSPGRFTNPTRHYKAVGIFAFSV